MNTLQVALEVAQTRAEGPGSRYAIWVQGCSLRCPGCCNPQFLTTNDDPSLRVPVELLLERIGSTEGIEGVTVLGGEPLEQAPALAQLLRSVQAQGLSTMVFTGYELEQVRGSPQMSPALRATDLLVDGRYDRSLPDTSRRWIGSTNQRMHWLTDRYQATDPCFREANTVELRLSAQHLTVNGTPWGRWLPRRHGD